MPMADSRYAVFSWQKTVMTAVAAAHGYRQEKND